MSTEWPKLNDKLLDAVEKECIENVRLFLCKCIFMFWNSFISLKRDYLPLYDLNIIKIIIKQ